MEYQIVLKQFHECTPVFKEQWKPDRSIKEQWKNMDQIPCRIQCIRSDEENEQRFLLCTEMIHASEQPISISLEFIDEEWTGREYVFMPAAVYDGNRLESKRIPYPPFHAGRRSEGWDRVITDIPHLNKEGEKSGISMRSGDMSTPAMGYFIEDQREGVLILANHIVHGRYTGFTVSEMENQAVFGVSCPAVREEQKYFFGELPDGSGFYPTCEAPSDDEGMMLREGERVEIEIRYFRFPAENLNQYFTKFNELREEMEQGQEFCSIPFSKAYDAIKEKYIHMNFTDEGYYRVGTENHVPPSYWQSGWVGGGMNSYAFLLEDNGLARSQSLSSLKFITEHLQMENGWYIPMYANGQRYGDNFLNKDSPVLLVRKDADLLYFLIKQAFYLKSQGELTEQMESSITRQADAFVRFYQKNGQLGQFINMEQETILQGDTASAAIASAALALAYEYFKMPEYLKTAEALGVLYWEEYLKKGMLNGGPGEICQAPDSESAFGFLESCVQLYETTGKEKWLQASREAFELAITWVMSYDFHLPERSTAAKMKAHTRGTVFANAQNKHSAPGICTLSGNSMLKLYRFTGDQKYLNWMSRISHSLSQFVSLQERPIDTLAGRALPAGYINERVQTSDWEGKETIGEFLYGSNWPEVTMLLTYVEIPGIYLDLDRRVLQCSDHIIAEIVKDDEREMLIKICNPTPYDAVVTLMIDHSMDPVSIGHQYFEDMQKIEISAGMVINAAISVCETKNRS